MIRRNTIRKLLAAWICCGIGSPSAQTGIQSDETLRTLQAEHGVQVHVQYTADWFPAEWRTTSVNATGTAVNEAELGRVLPVVESFLTAHDAAILRTNLEHIYLLGRLHCAGTAYGSTWHGSSLYLVCGPVTEGYTDEFLAERLHSEFSSLLFRNYRSRFPSVDWLMTNPPGFRYSGNGFEMLRNPTRYDLTEKNCADGFLLTYSRSSLENDFNMLSAWLFTKPERLEETANRHDRLRRKLNLTRDFYASLSDHYRF